MKSTNEKEGRAKIFRKKIRHERPAERFRKRVELGIKIFLMLIWPVVVGIAVTYGWYAIFYRNEIHFAAEAEGVVTTAWLSMFGIWYSLLATVAMNTVWSEYKQLRAAVKRHDKDLFMDLRDEDLSPLVYVLIVVLSLTVLFGFLIIEYPSVLAGAVIVYVVVFVLTLMLVVIIEMDDPCSGLWYIRHIPEDWLQENPKEYRRQRTERMKGGNHGGNHSDHHHPVMLQQ